MIYRFVFSVLFLTILSLGCYVDNDALAQEATPDSPAIKSYIDVDEDLWSHFQAFENEAAARNIHLNLVDLEITGVIENIQENGVAGTCQYGRHIHHVTIDRNFWNRSSSLIREMVVFHELGHCVLDRGHEESQNDNGVCLSIMNSGTTSCAVAYNQNNRDFYINELFSED